jgi:hypothetical protein
MQLIPSEALDAQIQVCLAAYRLQLCTSALGTFTTKVLEQYQNPSEFGSNLFLAYL